MSVIIPRIPIVAAMYGDLLHQVNRLFKKDPHAGTIEIGELWDSVKTAPDQFLVPLHSEKKPLIKTVNGQETLVMAWTPDNNYFASDFTLAMLFNKRSIGGGQEAFVPEAVLRGSFADVLILGGMSCCGEALQAHWTHVLSAKEGMIDASRVPLNGLPHNAHAHWLRDKVQVLDTKNDQNAEAVMKSIAYDVLGHVHDRPDLTARITADYLQYAAPATPAASAAPAPLGP